MRGAGGSAPKAKAKAKAKGKGKKPAGKVVEEATGESAEKTQQRKRKPKGEVQDSAIEGNNGEEEKPPKKAMKSKPTPEAQG